MPPGDSKADLGKRGCPRYPVVVITRDFERRVTLALSKEKEGKGSPLTGERYCPEVHKEHPEVHKEHPGGCATGGVLGPKALESTFLGSPSVAPMSRHWGRAQSLVLQNRVCLLGVPRSNWETLKEELSS